MKMNVHVRKMRQIDRNNRIRYRYRKIPTILRDLTINEIEKANVIKFSFAKNLTCEDKEIVLERWEHKKVYSS